MKKVGLLYDSVSSNTGDTVIGECLADFFIKKSIPYEIINPFNYDPNKYHTIVVGGGFLIREPGDSYYDQFRLTGPYILNGVGLAAKTNLDYLNDYKLVTVRSNAEKENLVTAGVKNVSVVPCVTTLMKGSPINIVPTSHTIGIHLTPDTLINTPSIHKELLRLPHDKIYIPFTHYNMDRSFMSHLPEINDHILLENITGEELFYIIGKMEYLITSSLHASIFAYIQNVPFLTIYQEKTFNYFKDRGLEKHIFKSNEDFKEKLKWLMSSNHNFGSSIKKDKKEIKKHLNNILKIIEEGPVKNLENTKQYVSQETADSLTLDQLKNSIVARDILIGKLMGNNFELESVINKHKERIQLIKNKIAKTIRINK